MVIKTRYRDIPWEEVCICFNEDDGVTVAKWSHMRGAALTVCIPALNEEDYEINGNCEGPFFNVEPKRLLGDGFRYCVCPHIAEIGD